MTNDANAIASNLHNELLLSGRIKRMKVRTLLKWFNYEKRTVENAAQMTESLFKKGIFIHPSIMKIEEAWQLNLDGQVYLSLLTKDTLKNPAETNTLPKDWNKDGWFDDLDRKLEWIRNEKEVESKLMIPLLHRLGYKEKDRYDGMTVDGSYGSKPTKLVVDYALFNKENENLAKQVLLIVEAKREDRLVKSVELENARNQVRSYGLFSGCLFGLITDANTIEVISLYPVMSGGKVEIFKCRLNELKDNFSELYKLISKSSLTNFYENKLKAENQQIL